LLKGVVGRKKKKMCDSPNTSLKFSIILPRVNGLLYKKKRKIFLVKE